MTILGLPINLYLNKYPYKYLAFYHAIRDGIFNGTIPAGTRLPSSRELASQYSLSRGTSNIVYEMLLADGYIKTKIGSGTYVSPTFIHENVDKKEINYQLSNWGKRLKRDPYQSGISPHIKYDFSSQRTQNEQFPIEAWKKAVNQGIKDREYLIDSSSNTDPKGLLELREGIANHLATTRAIDTNAENIVIINGSINGMAIIAQLLISEDNQILVEDPSYIRVRNIIETVGGNPIPFSIKDGLNDLANHTSRLAYVTPSSQYPTGRVMTLDERLVLLNWADSNNALIIEDDIDSLFSLKQRSVEPLKVLDSHNRVIYFGTFAFTLLTSLRIGYAVVPSYLMDDFINARNVFQPFTVSLLEQAAISQFIKNGSYTKHLRKMRRVYRQKHDIFMTLMNTHLNDAFHWSDGDTGMHIFGWWNGTSETYQIFQELCAKEGILWEDPSPYFFSKPKPCAVFYFSGFSDEGLEKAVCAMGKIYTTIRS
ncbi:PLP-dependent aminotransferase family protein [Bacillus sp. CGMCC 1.16607]|uniref:MocR-like pyridoxine biosynthesis transcription factor PdxR n=1 Tax=Bacillus sp. CGMCC 1.16607 TaxID=3351842 RepID=UPI0036323219